MALIRCDQCKKKISSLAETCPNCGAPGDAIKGGRKSKSTGEFILQLLCVLMGLYLVGLFIGGDSEKPSANNSSKPQRAIAQARMDRLEPLQPNPSDYSVGEYEVDVAALNARSKPVTGEVVSTLQQGELVQVRELYGRWGRINSTGEKPKWVAMQFMTSTEQAGSGSGRSTDPTAWDDPSIQTASKTAAVNGIKKQLRDPNSAQFKNLFTSPVPKYESTVVCGEVNSKGAGGGYTGFERFITQGDKRTAFESDPGEFFELWQMVCVANPE